MVFSRLHTPNWREGFARYRHRSANRGLWNGLRGAWLPSLGPTGRTLWDIGGRHKHGGFENMSGDNWGVAKNGYAIAMNGVDESVVLTAPGDTSFAFTSGFSVLLKIKATAANVGQYDVAFSCCDLGGNGWRMWTRDASTPKWYWECRDAGGAKNVVSPSAIASEWQTIVGTHDGGNLRLFLDGREVGTPRACGNVVYGVDSIRTNLGAMAQGLLATARQRWFPGMYATAAIWGRVLAPGEIQQLHQDQFALVRPRARYFPAVSAHGPFRVAAGVPYVSGAVAGKLWTAGSVAGDVCNGGGAAGLVA